MSPRRYRSEVRDAAASATRQRIVEAAIELYAERGVTRTSWEDLAEHAGVSLATTYRHFPTLQDLIPACARASFDVERVPTAREAAARFAGMHTSQERLTFLVRETCHCFVDARAWFVAAYREHEVVAPMGEVVARQRAALEQLVRAALGAGARAPTVRTLVALIDFPFWKALADAGTPAKRIADVMVQLVLGTIEKEDA